MRVLYPNKMGRLQIIKAQGIDFSFPMAFDVMSNESKVYRIDDIFLEIEHCYGTGEMILHQAYKAVMKETDYGGVAEFEAIEF